VSASGRDEKPSPTQPPADKPPLGRLQAEVITAVRGAITDVMAAHGPAPDMPDLDLDFSVRPTSGPQNLPALRAEPDRALTVPSRPASSSMFGWILGGGIAGLLGVGIAAGVIVGNWAATRSPSPVAATVVTAYAPMTPKARDAVVVARTEPALSPPQPKPELIAPDPVPATASPSQAVVVAPSPAPTLSHVPRQTLTPDPTPVPPSASETAVASAPDPTPAPEAKAALASKPIAAPKDTLATAHDLIEAGALIKARQLLQAEAPDRPAVALLLARSYDPNYLTMLPATDAPADIPQARYWYQRWYDLALKQGEVPQTMRLDLLLRSLDTATAAKP